MDKDTFLKPRLPEREVEIPGVGTVRVRGLSRAEILSARALSGEDATERFILLVALVDPQLTADEVVQWHGSATTAEMSLVLSAIKDLSGLEVGADKAAYKSVRGGRGS